MNILGLHFGHDAAVCVFRDGQIAAHVLRERHSRIKHAISLEFKTIQAAMDAAQLRWDQIDYCAITSTQNVELIIDDPDAFSVSFQRHPRHEAPCTLAELVAAQKVDPTVFLAESLLDILYEPAFEKSYVRRHYGISFPEHRSRERKEFTRFGTMDMFVKNRLWPGASLAQIAATDFSGLVQDDVARQGFHYPVTVRLGGCELPGYFIAHHMAHAASCYYQSGFDQAAILSHDGYESGEGYLSGFFFWAEGGRIYPVSPHHLTIGNLYELVGLHLGLGDVGQPGKLMGLAGYGQPRFFDRQYVGNRYDWLTAGVDRAPWLDHCLRLARRMGYDIAPFGNPLQVREPINVDIAASTQKLFEETYLLAVETLHKAITRMGLSTGNLCLTGGCALNCPANSRIYRESRFRQMFIEPGCDDSGLAVGAASWLYHNVLNHPRPAQVAGAYATPYLGLDISEEVIRAALDAAGSAIQFTACPDAALSAAEDLAADRVIGWFEGRSEIGPRALGHRSILADARPAANWARVNALKGREAWRPFAPAVLASESEKWFLGLPHSSPYMLFTGTVRSHQLPAITHTDGSARVQTVDRNCGEFARVLEHFFALTGVPIILNTSFNGPGEPIVETPGDAVRFLMQSTVDALYIGGLRVTRQTQS